MDDIIKQIEEELEQKNIMNKDIRTILDKYYTRLKIKGLEDLYGKKFFIPSFQRGYRWTEDNVNKLLEDLSNFGKNVTDKNIDYCLQPIIVEKNDDKYNLIDGQQRLTTLLLILKKLKSDKEYELEYDTKNNELISIINSEDESEENDLDTIDAYYIKKAKDTIKKFLEDKDKRNNILNVKKENRIKFLWYEIGEEDKSNQIFARINDGKISLSNAENSKALLLKLENNENGDEFEFKQKTDAMKWDEIENALENDEFWFFLTNQKVQYKFEKTRIDLIFDIYEKILQKQEENKKKNERKIIKNVFDYIEEQIYENVNNKEKIWNDLKSIYECLREWYDDSELYHLIGYLICISESNCIDEITKLIKKYRGDIFAPRQKIDITDKKKFKNYLYEKIKTDLINEYKGKQKNEDNDESEENNSIAGIIDEVTYGDDNKKIIIKILLLFNVLSMIGTEERISFNKYKNEEWDIEHIYPVHDNIDEPGYEKNKNALRLELKNFLEEFKKNNDIHSFKEITGEELEALKKYEIQLDDENVLLEPIADNINKIFSNVRPEPRHSLGNLTLLNAAINRGYKNDMFVEKRKIIIDKVDKTNNEEENKKFYILPCTERAFLKFYSTNIIQNNRWDENDATKYKDAIKNVLSKLENR